MKKKTLTILSMLIFVGLLFVLCVYNANADTKSSNNSGDYAVALSEYVLEDFDQNTMVVSPSGKTLNTDGKFVLTELGVYKVFKNHVLVKEINVIYKPIPVNFILSDEIVNFIETNVSFIIPKAEVFSAYESFSNYSVNIEKAGLLIAEFKNINYNINYSFSNSGNYTIRYYVVDEFGFTVDRKIDIEVLSKAEIINLDFGESWSVLNTVDFSGVQGIFEGISYSVDCTIKNPDGDFVDIVNNQYTFQKEGKYIATFTCDFNGNLITETREFNVVLSEGSYFSDGKNIVSITPSNQTEKNKGLEIKSEGVGSYIYYNKSINLDKFTKNDKLIDFYVPYNDCSDVNDIRVTLIDATDPDNYFSVYWRRSKSAGWEHLTYCLVEFNGYSSAISNESGTSYGKMREIYGAILTCSFTKEGVASFNITYSKEENTVYTYRTDAKGTYLVKLVDFDDLELLEKYLPWNGFKSNNIYLKIDFIDNVKSSIIIDEIDKKNLTQGEIPVENENYLLFNYKGEKDVSINDILLNNDLSINAYKNSTCYLPEPITENKLFGNFDVVLKVYIKNGQYVETDYLISNYSFIPTIAGEYKAEYSYTDYYGKKCKKEILFTVKDESAPDIKIHLAGKGVDELTITANLLSTIVVPEIVCDGGVGKIKSEIVYLLNGDTVIAPNEYGELYLDQKGYIDVVVIATDEVNTQKSVTFKILINNIQIIELEEEPKFFMAGREIFLKDFTARDYCLEETDPNFNMEKSIYIDDNLLVGNSFICPTDKDFVKVVYYGGKGTSKEVKKEVIVKVIPCNNNNQTLLNKLFNGVDSSISSVLFEEGYKIDFNNNLDINYVNPLISREFTFSFAVIEGKINFGSVDLKLCDYQNENNFILISFKNISLESADLYLNEVKVASISGSIGQFEGKTLKGITYSDYSINLYEYLKLLTLNNKKVLANITKNALGRYFNGFESGLIMLKLSTASTDGNSSIVIKNLSNQNFTSYAISNGRDKQTPTIGFLSEFDKRYSFNDSINIPVAVASDVLQGKVDVVDLVVTTPSGRTYSYDATKSHSMIFDEYGRYGFVFKAKDYYSNEAYVYIYVSIVDQERPILTVNDNIEDEILCGSTVKFGNYDAVDNIGVVNKKVYICTPESLLVEIDGEYIFTVAGNYKVIYYASDAVGNFTKQIYNVKVK